MLFYWLIEKKQLTIKTVDAVCHEPVFIVMNWVNFIFFCQKTQSKMTTEFQHFNILLSFVRSICKSNDPDQLLSNNKVADRNNKFTNSIIN